MNLQRCFRAIVWIAAVFLFAPGNAAAQCEANAWGYCADCTSGTPCCGYGPCNVFCGNCDGGCRRPPSGGNGDPSCGTLTGNALTEALRATSAAPAAPSEAQAWRAKFDTIDKNHNGTVSLAETQAWAKTAKKGMTHKQVREGFKKADANGNGKIEPGEVDRSLADAPKATAQR
jgi:hypothetical protein